MSLQACRSLFNHRLLSVTGFRSVRAYKAHDPNASVKPINEPPNEHLNFRPAILDDLPEPEGDWLEDYKKRQRKYWVHFFMGLTALSATLYYMWEYEPVMFNYYCVELPPKEERIKSFWEGDDEDEDDD